jgi:hypothetical protein
VTHPRRQVRAVFDETTITVYQAFNAEIAEAALAAGSFVPPFKRERMTWIKPSFLWMMYRSGWATKPGQDRILAVAIRRSGFQWALEHSCLSHFDPRLYSSWMEWRHRCETVPVRVQWDPERDVKQQALPYRSLQVGLRGEAVDRYIIEWIAQIRDITTLANDVKSALDTGGEVAARQLLPDERPYPLSSTLANRIGATTL